MSLKSLVFAAVEVALAAVFVVAQAQAQVAH
jgi:hypothetical protein